MFSYYMIFNFLDEWYFTWTISITSLFEYIDSNKTVVPRLVIDWLGQTMDCNRCELS